VTITHETEVTTTREATDAARRTRAPLEFAPLGLVWVKSTQRVVSLGLENALGAGARVHKGLEGPAAEAPSAVIYYPDGPDGQEDEEAAEAAVAREVESIRAQAPNTPILVCALAPDLQLARGAIKAGASGLLHIGMPPEQILRALSVALEGEVVLPRELLRLWVDEQRRLEPRIDLLSARHREVLELVGEGLSNAQIAQRMFLSESTIKQHLRAAYKLLGAKNRTEAAALLRGRGRRGVTPEGCLARSLRE
jgi:DNA-binding NarL/FixJ family response regulator